MDFEHDVVWKRILELSNRLRVPTEDVVSDKIHEIQRERNKLIRQYFEVSTDHVALKTLAQKIQTLLDINHDILNQWQRQKLNISESLSQQSTFRRANIAYLANSE